jgi:hypothetical protein
MGTLGNRVVLFAFVVQLVMDLRCTCDRLVDLFRWTYDELVDL